MENQLTINDQLFERLKASGEIKVQESHGVEVVVMTIDARKKLQAVAYDDSDWSPAEMMGVLSEQINDPEGMGAEGMDEYDEKYGHLFDNADANTQ